MKKRKNTNSNANGHTSDQAENAPLAKSRSLSYVFGAFAMTIVCPLVLWFTGVFGDGVSAADVDKLCDGLHHWGFLKGTDLKRCASSAILNAKQNSGNASAQALAGDALFFFDDRNLEAAEYFRKALELKGFCVAQPSKQEKQQDCILEFQSFITAMRRASNTAGVQEGLRLASEAANPVPSWKDPWQLPDSFEQALTAKPFWAASDHEAIAAIVKLLEDNYSMIRQELENMIAAWGDGGGLFQSEASAAKTLARAGNWTAVTLKINKKWRKQFCEVAMPHTCGLLRDRPDVSGFVPGQFSNASMPYVKLYRQTPGTHLRAHYGMTNSKLTAHLGLIVPKGSSITVRGETRSWEEGKALVFDDSFEHEAVTANPTDARYVLNVGFWHPELQSLLEMPR
eukprot:gnl/MRDRNA2_/MRDRNA2_29008_c0_seq1.p1 gnl/MRDRNA2_/MRDRNA2_29008_c0~~gnl/MRDRNA2_/MRDRNA2_29008_c0_seq1.p1  ORF type:complete len:398 (+),score=82.70 gnl/MRDRNA2_/MRDRNA2_29008_c0_seq1:68-1261(+)